jgi:hypothetical protein
MKNLSKIYILLFVFVLSSCINEREQEARRIVNKIKEYKLRNGMYPLSLEDIGVSETEEGPFYYELIEDSNEFILSYGLNLGDSRYYKSKDDKWYGQ